MKKNTILVVEDEAPLLKAIGKKLELMGFEGVSARSVDQALEYLETLEEVSCVWLDHYLLGKESGLDLLVKLKSEDSKWKNIPVYVVSNTASSDKVEAYLKLGASKYFVKANFRLDEIIAMIKSDLDARDT